MKDKVISPCCFASYLLVLDSVLPEFIDSNHFYMNYTPAFDAILVKVAVAHLFVAAQCWQYAAFHLMKETMSSLSISFIAN